MNLFIVTVTREAFVLANTANEAESLMSEIDRWEDYPTVEVQTATASSSLDGWTNDCLVYCKGKRDITLGAARVITK